MVVLQGCKPVICSYDYSSYFICDSDSMACCGDHRSGRCCMFYIAVYNWLDIELEFDITKLSCRMFGYTNLQGHRQACFNMTRDGFVFLVMGYRGKKAASFKEAYIKRFLYSVRSHSL